MTAFARKAFSLAAALLLAAPASALWGDVNLLADPLITPGTIVLVAFPGAPAPLSARVVKVLPEGGLVLVGRLIAGRGYVLFSGTLDRADLVPARPVDAGRLARLAIVVRGRVDGFEASAVPPGATLRAGPLPHIERAGR